MSSWLELLLLAIASMFWPTLIVIVVFALRLEQPVRILFWFLVGGLLTTVTVGIVIVFELQGAISGSSRSSVDPAVDIAVGLLSLVGAYLLHRRESKQLPAPSTTARSPARQKKPSIAERAVGGGVVVAFAAGVVLNILPGTFPIVALKDIAELDASNTVKVAAIVVFYVIMFTFTAVLATGEGPGVTALATTAVLATGAPMTPTRAARAGLRGMFRLLPWPKLRRPRSRR